MKKLSMFLFAFISSIFCFMLIQSDAIHGAAIELHLRSEYDHEDANAYYYKIYVSVIDGSNVSIGGFRVYYDNDHFEPLLTNGKPTYQRFGEFANASVVVSLNPTDGFFGVGFMGSSYLTVDEDMICFTVKSINKSEITNNPSLGNYVAESMWIDRLEDELANPISEEEMSTALPTYVEALYYNYVVGSLAYANGSQPIGLLDAQRLQALVNTYGTLSVNSVLTQNQANAIGCPGLIIDTTDFNTIVALRVADVDGDGDVDQDDADELLEYYVNVVLLSMNPPSGNRIGMTDGVYHIIQIP